LRLICEPRFGDRWKEFVSVGFNLDFVAYTEPDTGMMIESVTGLDNVSFVMHDQETIVPVTVVPGFPPTVAYYNFTSD